MDQISGCEAFLGDAFAQCEDEEDGGAGVFIGIIVAMMFIGICGCIVCRICSKMAEGASGGSTRTEIQEMANQRGMMSGAKGVLPAQMQLSGTYTENGETKPTSYQFSIDFNGSVTGQSFDDDGAAQVTGKVNYANGEIRWNESRPGVNMEVSGQVTIGGQNNHQINASYVSSYGGTRGSLYITSAAGSASGSAVVVGASTPVFTGQGKEGNAVVVGSTMPSMTPVVMGQVVAGSGRRATE